MTDRRSDGILIPTGSLRGSHSTRQLAKHDLAARLQFRAKSEMDMTLVGTGPSELSPPPQPMPCAPSPILRRAQRRMTSSLDTVTQKPAMMTRKKTVTLQEFFTLIIDLPSETHRECIRACKGLTLKEAVAPLFSTKGLSLHSWDFFVEGSASPLPRDVETSHLAGIVVHVKSRHLIPGSPQREEPKGVVLRQSRERKNDKRNSAGVIPLADTANLKLPNRQRRASFSLLFPSSRLTEADASQEKLDRFNEVLNGLNPGNAAPRVCEKDSSQSYEDFCEEGHSLCLEENWQRVVKNHELLSKKESAQQSAVWELLSTEINYMRILKSLIDVYAKSLLDLQKREDPFLTDISYNNLFSNIKEVYQANHTLWVAHMSQVLEFSRKTGNTLNPSLLKDTFNEMPNIFNPYVEFCKATDACQRYLQTHKENNQMFAAFLTWADNQILNELRVREGLKAHLTKPMQRLTRYKVILMRIRDETVDEQVRGELQEMIDTVDDFVCKVNNEVAVKQKMEKLQEVHKKIGPYDCVETPGEEYNQFASKYSGFKVKTLMRHNQLPREILMEGHLKMKEGQTRWTEVYCILFTDLFLICKTSKRSHADRLRVIKPPMRLDMVRLHMVNTPSPSLALVHLTEFDCLANLFAFTEDSQKLDQWFAKFTEAYRAYKEALAGFPEKEDPSATRYSRTFSVPSDHPDTRRRSSTFGSSNTGSAPSLSPLTPHHPSRSPLRRFPIEASPLSRETSVTSSAPSVTSPTEGSPRRLPRTPLFSLSSVDDSPFSGKKRLSLGSHGPNPPVILSPQATSPLAAAPGASLESFRSSSGVSSVDSAHAYSGSELSTASLRPSAQSGLESSSSTLNGEKLARFASVSSLSGSEEEGPELEGPPRPGSIRVVDKRFSRSLNDLSLHTLSIAPASPEATSPATSSPKRRAPPPPSKTSPKRMSPEQMRVLLIEGSDAEATSV